ncbi:MAG: hypothetical protein K1X83_05440 [Oligoflexia bacterium]|nr:hypothetical protein [Oligoflexia bacterium]
MKRSIFDPPEAFSLSPLLALLPQKGQLSKLETLSASLFARYERVTGLLGEIAAGSSPELETRLSREQNMLRQVLEWLNIKPEGQA